MKHHRDVTGSAHVAKGPGTSRDGHSVHRSADSLDRKDSRGEYSSRVGSHIQALGSVKWYRALTVRDGPERGLDFCPRRASDSGFQNLASVTSLQMSFLIVSDRDAQHLLALSREGLGRAEPLEHRQMSTNEKLEMLTSLNNGVCTQREVRV